MQKTSGIYMIESSVNGKKYIGSSNNMNARKAGHYHKLRKGDHRNGHLQNHVNKNGIDSLRFSVLEYCIADPIHLASREEYWVKKIKPKFNIRDIGYMNIGGKLTAETRQKLSHATKSRFAGVDGEKYRAMVSVVHKGKEISDDHKLALSQSMKGEGNPFYGKKHTEESRKKIKEARSKQVYTEEHRQKLSKLHKGKKRSAETCRKISEIKKAYYAEKRLAQQN